MPTVMAMNDDVTSPKPTNMLCTCLHGHAYTQHGGPPSRDAGFQERTRLHGHGSTRTHSMMGRPRATQGKRARRAPAVKHGYAPLLWGPAPACPPFTRLAPASGEPSAPLSRFLHESTA